MNTIGVMKAHRPILSALILRETKVMNRVKVRVLIVENEAIISMDLRYSLEVMGYCVTGEVISGEEAVEAASQQHPDVVLMDIGLGGEMDGSEAAEEIRRSFNIPVVFLTGSVDQAASARSKNGFR